MALAQDPGGNKSQRVTLTRDEERIATAVATALTPHYDNIGKRLDGIDGKLNAMEALIVANHEDIMTAREENESLWQANGDIWRKMHSDVEDLLESQNAVLKVLKNQGIEVDSSVFVRQPKRQ